MKCSKLTAGCKLPFVIAVAVAVVGAVAASSALANDTSFGDDNGTIVFKSQPDISMDKEVLLLSEAEVQVEYTFTNTSKTDLTVPITFPMPPMYFGLSDHNTIEDFKLWVDGQAQNVGATLVVQLDDGTDISKQMAQSGWSVNEVVDFVEEQKLPTAKSPLPKIWFDADGAPKFKMSNYFTWQQVFRAGKSINVRHAYTPSKTTGVPQSSEIILQDFSKSTCIDAAARAGIKKRENADGVNWSYLRYILVTANNWQGSIKDFDLTIKKKNAADLISLCFDGELKKEDSLTFKFHATNFKPKDNLGILFIGNK
jgi:Domain of unknown function (DUF4424)